LRQNVDHRKRFVNGRSGNSYWRGRFGTDDLLVKIGFVQKKVHFKCKKQLTWTSKYREVNGTHFPVQWGFPGGISMGQEFEQKLMLRCNLSATEFISVMKLATSCCAPLIQRRWSSNQRRVCWTCKDDWRVTIVYQNLIFDIRFLHTRGRAKYELLFNKLATAYMIFITFLGFLSKPNRTIYQRAQSLVGENL